MALNVAISYYRKTKKATASISLSEIHTGHLAHTVPVKDEEDKEQLLQQEIAALKELAKALIILYLEEKSYREIAEIMALADKADSKYPTSKTGIVAYQVNQLLQQVAINYDPADLAHFKLSGEHYFTHQKGSPDLKYFFADASLRFSITKWKTDFEISAANFLNVKKYNALYLSANTFITGLFTLPGRIILFKMLFKI